MQEKCCVCETPLPDGVDRFLSGDSLVCSECHDLMARYSVGIPKLFSLQRQLRSGFWVRAD